MAQCKTFPVKVTITAERIIKELITLRGGVADTCTLIYLEQTGMLSLVSDYFQLLIPADVVREFGRTPPGCVTGSESYAGDADQAVVLLAKEFHLPVLSEDRRLLMSCRDQGLKYYNTLMILLALLHQQKIHVNEYHRAYSSLQKVARYSPAVWLVGEQVFSLYVR